eukprot:1083138-Prymnesium_polylepis.1
MDTRRTDTHCRSVHTSVSRNVFTLTPLSVDRRSCGLSGPGERLPTVRQEEEEFDTHGQAYSGHPGSN